MLPVKPFLPELPFLPLRRHQETAGSIDPRNPLRAVGARPVRPRCRKGRVVGATRPGGILVQMS